MTKDEKEALKGWCTRVLVVTGLEDGVDAIVNRWEAEVDDAIDTARQAGHDAGWTDGQQQMYDAGAKFD